MQPSHTVSRQLDVNIAVALRLIRTGSVPREFFVWLARPMTNHSVPVRWANLQLTESLAAIVASVSADATHKEQSQIASAPAWLGAISNYLADSSHTDGGHCMRLLAASLLPLYRTLATGKLQEGFEATQQRLTENLVLIGLCHELGAEFRELLEQKLASNGAPPSILQNEFKLDLRRIGQAVQRAAIGYDATTDCFSNETIADLIDDQVVGDHLVADWATPELLWRLAGELVAKKAEMVLPRAWIDTPVPWSKIAEHWNRLQHTLVNLRDRSLTQRVEAQRSIQSPIERPAQSSIERPIESARAADKDAEAMLERIREAVEQEIADNGGLPSSAQPAEHGASIEMTIDQSLESVDLHDASNSSTAETVSVPEEHCVPKVLLAEIRSHNDPAFVNVVRRKLALCRTEERALCLSHIVVSSDDETQMGEVRSVRANGLTLWQQKLVNWLADHPHVVDPYAFLTSDGELILCVLDLERNEMTTILRQGLVEVLTGKHVEDASDLSLAKVHIPARFHAGISSTSSPGANMTAEQLIGPAIRCLTAAQRHGRASIKSIEVY